MLQQQQHQQFDVEQIWVARILYFLRDLRLSHSSKLTNAGRQETRARTLACRRRAHCLCSRVICIWGIVRTIAQVHANRMPANRRYYLQMMKWQWSYFGRTHNLHLPSSIDHYSPEICICLRITFCRRRNPPNTNWNLDVHLFVNRGMSRDQHHQHNTIG